jgi:hypothetical protein
VQTVTVGRCARIARRLLGKDHSARLKASQSWVDEDDTE